MSQAGTRSGNHRPCGRAVVCRLGSLGHDAVAMIRDVAASRCLPSGIALRVADYGDASALKKALAGAQGFITASTAMTTMQPRMIDDERND